MTDDPARRRSRSRSHSASSRRSRASGSMGPDGGEAGKRMAAEEEYIRKELNEATSFCNAFWGTNDAGYEVIQARMKTASRTMDEVRSLYKERAEIEADYAKKLAKLAKGSVGKDETGSTRQALDVVRAELDMTSRVHADLSSMIRKDLEATLSDFQAKAVSARKNSSAVIDKLYKNKQAQENYVHKSRERYEQDCIKINGYTAQSSLVQGRDLDKVNNKLDKAQSTVAANEKDYQNFVRALKDTTLRWNSEWKAYLDQCQDLEEDRLDFLKSNLWNYANAISAVCVADDEGCERIRVALENCETPRDISVLIQQRSTGPAIPDPPEYINYAKGQPPPPRPTYHVANFQRSTTRPPQPPPAPPSQPFNPGSGSRPDSRGGSQPPPPSGGMAEPAAPASLNRTSPGNPAAAPANFKPPPGAVGLPGMSAPRSQGPTPSPRNEVPPNAQPPYAAPAPAPAVGPSGAEKAERRMSTKNFLARTPSMAKRDSMGTPGPNNFANRPPSAMGAPAAAAQDAGAGGEEDPIAKALANLRMRPGGRSPGPQASAQRPPSGHSQRPSVSQRPVSPGPSGVPRPSSPAAAFMQAPQQAQSPVPVEEVLGSYGQSFPGERKALSRQNSVSSAISGRSQQAGAANPARAKSPSTGDGFAGVGARGRSPSPQPFGRPASRQQQHQQQHRPASVVQQPNRAPGNIQAPQQQPQRSATPLGISLDASGSVTHDQMAQEYMRRAGSVPPPQQQQQPAPSSTPQPHMQAQYQSAPGGGAYAAQSQHQPPQRAASTVYGHQQQPTAQSQASAYAPQHAGMASAGSSYTITPGQYGGQPPNAAPPQQQQQQQQQQQPPQGYYGTIPLQSPYAQGSHAQPSQQQQQPAQAPPFVHQDSSSSIGRAPYEYSGYNQHQPAPSQSQSLHGSMSHHAGGATPLSSGTPGPGQYQNPAAPYLQQYHSSQNQIPQQTSSTPSPYGQPPQLQHQAAGTPTGAWGQQANGTHPPGPHGYAQPQHGAMAVQHQAPPPQQPQQQQQQPAAPTGQYSDAGKPILFYVKAMYDYSATTDEEFSFTQGDIIAVTQTDPDGWWQGELLDEARRRRGANTFPSNFTTLLT